MRVLLRVDFDVAIKNGRVARAEWGRIIASLPTILYLAAHGARVIIATHCGRPDGKRVPALSTRPLAAILAKLLKRPVAFVPDIVGHTTAHAIGMQKNGDVILLENVRFDPREEKNDPAFSRALAAHADIFVNDAFAVLHRAHASVVGVTKYIPSYAGLLIEKEIKNLDHALHTPRHPFVLVMGGIKLETKLPAMKHLLPSVDRVLLGGALAHALKTFDKKILKPIDMRGNDLDIGPKTEKEFAAVIRSARTIVWNGPLGKSEDPRYRHGTIAIARAVSRATHRGAFSLIGGGDTVAALSAARVHNSVSFISTGGGAMLEYLAGKELPGLTPLIVNL